MEVTRTEMDDELNATLHCEDGRALRINIGDLLHTHGKVAAVTSTPNAHGPRLRLAVDTRGHGGYRGVLQMTPTTWRAHLEGHPYFRASSARGAATQRAIASAANATARRRLRTAGGDAPAQEASAQEASGDAPAQEAPAQEDPPPVASPVVDPVEEEDDDVVFSHEVSREERDREGRRNAICLDDDE